MESYSNAVVRSLGVLFSNKLSWFVSELLQKDISNVSVGRILQYKPLRFLGLNYLDISKVSRLSRF